MTSLANDLAEGQDTEDAARSTAAELASRQQMLAIYDADGRLLAEEGRDDDLAIALPALATDSDRRGAAADRRRSRGRRRPPPPGVSPRHDSAVRHRIRRRRRQRRSSRPTRSWNRCAGSSATWCRSRWSSPASAAGSWRARACRRSSRWPSGRGRIGVENLSERLPVANPRDELGQLAETFNELLGRLEASLIQQRQFMADASHELRTPVATARTAASVALQQPHRDEREYRETLAIIEQQTARLSRIVDDMFTLARADAGNYPVRTTPMYLDEVVDEVVRAARVLASTKDVSIEPSRITVGRRSPATRT